MKTTDSDISPTAIIERTKLGKSVTIHHYANIYDSILGDFVKVGHAAEIGNAKVGNYTRIGKGAFLCAGVELEDNVFIAPGVFFSNDKNPRINKLHYETFLAEKTLIKHHASIGINATICPGITIGEYAMIGAGAVVTRDVPAHEVWIGNPARRHDKSSLNETT